MNIRATTALVLALAAASSSAAKYQFTYTGLWADLGWRDDQDGFQPDWVMSGAFEGEDTNGDGSLQAQELTDFYYSLPRGVLSSGMHVIGPDMDPWECPSCRIESFEYTPGGTLEFVAIVGGYRTNHTITSNFTYGQFYTDWWYLGRTLETVVNVTSVPEPGTASMFLAGMLGLAYLSKRNAARK